MKSVTRREKAAGARDLKMAPTAKPLVGPDSPGKESVDSGPEELAYEVAKLLEPKFAAVLQKLTEMSDTFGELNKRVEEVEQRVASLEEGESATQRAQQQRQIDALLLKVDDLENRSRRNNLRLIGIPESWTGEQLFSLFSTWLPKELGLTDLQGRVHVERAHRLGQWQEGRARPRPVLARLLDFHQKTLILQAYRKKRDLKLDNMPVYLFQDYSASLAAKRKEFSSICTELIQGGIRFALSYPATLKIFHKGATHTFEQAPAARKFVTALTNSPALAADQS